MAQLSKITILNVDDDDAGRYAISKTLQHSGFQGKLGTGSNFTTDMKTYGTRRLVANYDLKGVNENARLS